jgi:hypothetical protein
MQKWLSALAAVHDITSEVTRFFDISSCIASNGQASP